MREMKDSGVEFIGSIPTDWKILKVKYLGEYRNGLTYTPNDLCDKDEGILVLRSSNIKYGKLSFDDNVYVSCYVREDLKVRDGDILICSRNGSQDLVGKNALVNGINATFGAFMMIYRCEYPQYMYYILNSPVFSYYLGTFFAATIGQLTGANFGNMLIPYCPNKEQQQQITAYLATQCVEIDALVTDIQNEIEILEEYKRSVITEAVTKGLDSDVEMRSSAIEWVDSLPTHWSETRIGYSAWLRARLGWKGLKADEYVDEGYPFLSAFNIIDSLLSWENLNFINEERYIESPEIMLNIGDILLVKDGAGIGKCARIDALPMGKSTTNGSLAVITTLKGLNYKYLYYFFLSAYFQNYIQRIMNGMGVPHLSQEELRKIVIPLPPTDEQKRIVDYLDNICTDIYSAIIDKKKQISTIEEYKKSLIYEYVTGKKEV